VLFWHAAVSGRALAGLWLGRSGGLRPFLAGFFANFLPHFLGLLFWNFFARAIKSLLHFF
jgi:hypothetical protein